MTTGPTPHGGPGQAMRSAGKAMLTRSRSIGWAARRRRTNTSGLRILFYHRVSDDRDDLAVGTRMFERQMDWLAASGYRAVTTSRICDLLDANELPENVIGLSFDDGYRDVAQNAVPVLERHGFEGTVFVAPALVEGTAAMSWYIDPPPLLTWEEIERLDVESPLAFESHSLTHPLLLALDEELSRTEIFDSKRVLEQRLGRAVEAFCYPAGVYGDRERRFVREAGYRLGVSVDPGTNVPETDRAALHRIQVDARDSLLDFQAKVAGAHDESLPFRALYRRKWSEQTAAPAPPRLASAPVGAEARPDVTVSIVNHEDRERLLECLESLQSGAAVQSRIEIVVLDNASNDGSVEAVRERFPAVRLIAQTHRAGFGANHNSIIRESSARYVFVLNPDARVEPEAIDRMVGFLDAHPSAGALGPHIVHPSGRRHPSAWRFPTPAACGVFALTLGAAGIVQSDSDESRRVDWVSGSAMMLRRSALEQIGLFDERFFMYMEETDLCHRLHDDGYEVVYFPEAEVVHHQWGSTWGMEGRRTNEVWRSRQLYWRKHHSDLGMRIARNFDRLRYTTGAALAGFAFVLPKAVRPGQIGRDDVRRLALNARTAWLGPRGPGLRELAAETNDTRATQDGKERKSSSIRVAARSNEKS